MCRRFFYWIPLLVIALISLRADAQEIKAVSPDFKGYEALLNAAGYELYSFDISELAPKKYLMEFSVREYRYGEKVEPSFNGFKLPEYAFSNLKYLSDVLKSLKDEKEIEECRSTAVDPANDIYSMTDRINIGLLPGEADSIKKYFISAGNMGSGGYKFELLPLTIPGKQASAKPRYRYVTRPFEMPDTLKTNEFIPLICLMSMYYDEECNIFRSCGESTLSPDIKKSPLLERTPDCFIIGVRFKEKRKSN